MFDFECENEPAGAAGGSGHRMIWEWLKFIHRSYFRQSGFYFRFRFCFTINSGHVCAVPAVGAVEIDSKGISGPFEWADE